MVRPISTAFPAPEKLTVPAVWFTMPTAPLAMCWFAIIAKPKDILCDQFCVDAIGESWAPCYIPLEKGSFLSTKDVFGQVVNYSTKARKYRFRSKVWSLWSELRTNKNRRTVPAIKIRPSADLTDEQVEEIIKALGR